jgi:hypothetical protein
MVDPNYLGADWGEIWLTVESVSPEAWDEIKLGLVLNRFVNTGW